MTTKTRIGIIQLCATNDVVRNLEVTKQLSEKTIEAGADVVFLPEAFAYIGSDRERQPHLETLDNGGPIFRVCQDLARTHNVHVIAGGYPEKSPDGRAFNTCLHIDSEGNLVSAYRKIHLFDVDLPDGTRMLESRGTCPGDRAITTDLPFGKLGMTVCYDVRFPNLYQDLVSSGAMAITIPAAFVYSTGLAHWHVLMRARAIECQAYIIAPAQYGDHQHRGRRSFGHAMVVDPWGKILVECGEDKDDFAVVDIDPEEVERVRNTLPSINNRRQWH